MRACPYGDGGQYHFEIKCIDGTANPYLALSAILSAGMIGVKNSYPLRMKPCQGTPPPYAGLRIDEPGKMSDEARRDVGITQTLPRSVQEALVTLERDPRLVKELGEEFVRKYISVKEVSTSLRMGL